MSFEEIEISYPAACLFQITINRPRQFNALSAQTIIELLSALETFERSEDRVMILTGAGRAFCFGADFLEFENRSALHGLLSDFQSLISRLYHSTKVTVASLNGFATGAGFDLALACDFRIASDKAKLGEAYISMGLVPDGGGTCFLPRIIGESRALEMLMTGGAVSADQAFSMGLVHRVVPASELTAASLAFVVDLAAKPQTALRLIKRLVKSTAGEDLNSALQKEREAQLQCFEDADHQKLAAEFIAKRRKSGPT